MTISFEPRSDNGLADGASLAGFFSGSGFAGAARLTEIEDFGANPGRLTMLCHVPQDVAGPMPLVVVLHGCQQTASIYDRGAGWAAMGDRHGFAVLYAEQQRRNNPHLCFDWYLRNHSSRDRGQPASIREMIDRMVADHPIDRTRIFVTGLSAGGAMASILLATYPEVFAGGAILAGLPYRAATTLRGGVDAMTRGTGRSHAALADAVREATDHAGPWPRISVWHGTADDTVAPANAEEIAGQWLALRGLDRTAPTHDRHDRSGRHVVWSDGSDRPVVELRLLDGLGHGAPVRAGAATWPMPFFLPAAVSSTEEIAKFFGLLPEAAARPAPAHAAIDDKGGFGAWIASHLGSLLDRLRLRG